MALPATQRFSNATVGQTQAGADIVIYRVDTACQYAVGQGFTRADGNMYRYCSFDTTVTQGKLVAPVFANSGKATTDNVVINPTSAVVVASEYPILPGQVGSHFVEVTLASIAANQFQGGYFITEDGSGKAYSYRIRGNTATGNPASGNIRIQLYDAIAALLSPNTDIQIVPSMYNDVDVASAATNWAVAGATCASMTAGTFGWICTHGVNPVLQDGTVTGGDPVALSAGTSGAVTAYGAGTTDVANLTGVQPVGYCIQTGATTEYASIYLQLE